MNESAAPRASSADSASWSCKPSSFRSVARAVALALLPGAVAVASAAAAAPTGTPPSASAGTSAVIPRSTSAVTSAIDPAPDRADARWGAIAARPDGYGYAFNQPSRAAAEQVARTQCERPASPPASPNPAARAPASSPGTPNAVGACEVRVWFERGCGALATGNFGEWGAAVGADRTAAVKAALARCDAHLPTEPCRVVASACSAP